MLVIFNPCHMHFFLTIFVFYSEAYIKVWPFGPPHYRLLPCVISLHTLMTCIASANQSAAGAATYTRFIIYLIAKCSYTQYDYIVKKIQMVIVKLVYALGIAQYYIVQTNIPFI